MVKAEVDLGKCLVLSHEEGKSLAKIVHDINTLGDLVMDAGFSTDELRSHGVHSVAWQHKRGWLYGVYETARINIQSVNSMAGHCVFEARTTKPITLDIWVENRFHCTVDLANHNGVFTEVGNPRNIVVKVDGQLIAHFRRCTSVVNDRRRVYIFDDFVNVWDGEFWKDGLKGDVKMMVPNAVPFKMTVHCEAVPFTMQYA